MAHNQSQRSKMPIPRSAGNEFMNIHGMVVMSYRRALRKIGGKGRFQKMGKKARKKKFVEKDGMMSPLQIDLF